MGPNVLRRAIASLAIVALACALMLAAAVALAAKPKKGAHFSGHTSVSAVEGFRAPVTFSVSSNGRSLKGFTYGSFGCFGAGGFRPGVNPYTGNSLVHLGAVAVSRSGKISVTGAKRSYSVAGQTTVTTVSISGEFLTAKSASGTISFSQTVTGSTFKSSCGPAKVTFSAKTG
jgi:hypothetical protein